MGEKNGIIYYGGRQSEFRSIGFDSFDSLYCAKGILADKNKNRDVLKLAPLTHHEIPYVKRFHPHRGHRPKAVADDEMRRIQRFQGLGFPGPDCAMMAWEEERGCVMLFMAPANTLSLEEFLKTGDPRSKGEVLKKLGRVLGAIHRSGIRMPDLMGRHVMVTGEKDLYFIDLARLRFNCFRRQSRIRDLARLFATIGHKGFSRPSRLRFLRTYCQSIQDRRLSRNQWSQLLKKIRAYEKKFHDRGRFPRDVELYEVLGEGCRAYVNVRFKGEMDKIGFKTPNDFIHPSSNGALLRDISVRRNYRIHENNKVYFLKSHREGNRTKRGSMGKREWENHLRLMWADIPAPLPVAWGQGRGVSFFMSLSCGENTLEDRAKDLNDKGRGKRKTLAINLGHLVRRMHGFGYFHRDLYLCHLITDHASLRVIDLQRMVDAPFFKRHRKIKDLAALLYSSWNTQVSNTDRLRFIKTYLGAAWIRKRNKGLIRSVVKKAQKIQKRLIKKAKTSRSVD